MQLSVVILNYNVRYFLELCLDSVQKSIAGLEAEIIVVDNASQDGSCEMVRLKFPGVILIENHENAGFPKGNNIGVSKASGEYLCILNPDTVVAEHTFTKLLAFAKSANNAGIIGCRLIDGAGKFLPESKRGVPTPFVALTKITGLHNLSRRFFGKYYAMHLNESQSGPVEILVGAFMLMQRDLYVKLGGFDEDCFMYSDDIDLSYRALKAGRTNYYFAGATVIHFKGESTLRDALYMQRFREAMHYFYKKHFRVSWVFDVFMTAGAYFFARVKKSQAVTKPRQPDHFLMVTTDAKKQRRIKGIRPDLQIIDKLSTQPDLQHTQLILDTDLLSYEQCIACMSQSRNHKTTFRFALANYLIGSDSSNDRGEITVF